MGCDINFSLVIWREDFVVSDSIIITVAVSTYHGTDGYFTFFYLARL